MPTTTDSPVLRLEISAANELRADLVGAILSRLNDNYRGYQERIGTRATPYRLRLRRLAVGSLLADIASVADGVSTLYEHRETVAGFMTQLMDALTWMLGGRNAREPSLSEKITLKVLARPVAQDGARQLSLQLVGDNNVVLVITPEAAEAILRPRGDEESSRRDREEAERAHERLGRDFGDLEVIEGRAVRFGRGWGARVGRGKRRESDFYIPLTITNPGLASQLEEDRPYRFEGYADRSSEAIVEFTVVRIV